MCFEFVTFKKPSHTLQHTRQFCGCCVHCINKTKTHWHSKTKTPEIWVCVNESCRIYEWVMCYTWMRHWRTESRHTCKPILQYKSSHSIQRVMSDNKKDMPSFLAPIYTHRNWLNTMTQELAEYNDITCISFAIYHIQVYRIIYKYIISFAIYHIQVYHMTMSYNDITCISFAKARHVTRVNESCHTYEWVMSHIWMSHVTHASESCHTYEWVMLHVWVSHEWDLSHIWTRHVTNRSFHTHQSVMSHIWMSLTYIDGSCHTYGWVMSHIWMRHVTHINESCHKYE